MARKLLSMVTMFAENIFSKRSQEKSKMISKFTQFSKKIEIFNLWNYREAERVQKKN